MEDAQKKIDEIVKNNKAVVFMKGSKAEPQCGFSAAVVEVFSMMNVEFVDVNVLADESIRQGIKEYSNWPTIPQVYLDGKFVGGCDIVREMFQAGELQKLAK